MAGYRERDAYFKEHGPTPTTPYIVRSHFCGCYEVWDTPAMGSCYTCPQCAAASRTEMRQLQQRRYAHAGLDYGMTDAVLPEPKEQKKS